MSDDAAADLETVYRIIEKTTIAMMTTHDGERMDARPMAGTLDREAHAVWFLSDRKSRKIDETKADEDALLSYADEGSQAYLSVRGRLRMVEDRAKVKEIWSPYAATFFPDGPESPGIALLRFDPQEAQYWRSPPQGVIGTVKYVQAKLTGERPKVGDHGTVRM